MRGDDSAPARAAAAVRGANPVAAWVEGTRLLERMRLLSGWEGLLGRLSVPPRAALAIAERARLNGTGFHAEFIAAGLVPEEQHYRALAAELGLPHVDAIDPDRLILRDADLLAALKRPAGNSLAMVENGAEGPDLVLAPARLDLASMKAMLARGTGVNRRLKLAGPSRLRSALFSRAEQRLLEGARGGLFAAMPEMSARLGPDWKQGIAIGAGVIAVPAATWFWPAQTLLAAVLLSSLLFLSCILLRLAAAVEARPGARFRPEPAAAGELPHYSVVVALRREAEVVPDLLAALGRLDWPRSKLEVKLVCEADDAETLAALAPHALRPWVEVVRVPPAEPRTKPKALAYVLPVLAGEIVALYDAEDRPHPLQLREAWDRFRRDADGDLAAVQAPIVVANGDAGWIAAMFRLEYAAHFGGILPWLARRRLVLPLGGTSNHFRRDVLVEVGGWDPFNVTEDADLGLRLARFGYRTETIACPTLEDGPEEAGVWIGQRARWIKGWMQTWLVHMRSPRRLWRDLGPASFLVFQIVSIGMVASTILHPLLVGTALWMGARHAGTGVAAFDSAMLAVAVANLLLGYGAFLALGWRCLPAPARRKAWMAALLVPPYWLMMSFAAFRAGYELLRRPHHWHKTPHRPHRRAPRPEPGAQQPPMPRPARSISASAGTARGRPGAG